jgi:hypothetical protein
LKQVKVILLPYLKMKGLEVSPLNVIIQQLRI